MQHQPLNPDHLAALLQWARKHKFPTLTRVRHPIDKHRNRYGEIGGGGGAGANVQHDQI